MPQTVIIASTNPVKINAGTQACRALWPDTDFIFQGCNAASNVPDQPMGSAQTRQGAENRLAHARALHPEADLWIAFEGGVEETGTPDNPVMTSVIWVVATDRTGRFSPARCVSFEIPPMIADMIRGGMTLGAADDAYFGRQNSNQQNGSIGIVTHDVLTRTSVYRDGAVMALVPFRNPAWYSVTLKNKAA